MVHVEHKVKIEIDGHAYELTEQEARNLYAVLKLLFDKELKQTPLDYEKKPWEPPYKITCGEVH